MTPALEVHGLRYSRHIQLKGLHIPLGLGTSCDGHICHWSYLSKVFYVTGGVRVICQESNNRDFRPNCTTIQTASIASRENNAARHPPAKPCHTVHSNAATRFLSKLGVKQLEPIVHNLSGRRGTVIKRPVLEVTKEARCRTSERINIQQERLLQMCICVLTLTTTWIPSFSTGALSQVASQTLTSVFT